MHWTDVASICATPRWSRILSFLTRSIELHAPISSTQKLKLMGRGSLRPQTWNRSQQQLIYLNALIRIRTRDLWL
ncbi:hypothetical protein BDA96_10G060700 [Sorghum bicolor]|uniref:Uncharacterized protein n=1 Tax=Sorghum bicolor TaxID=4558 RepID=A0A921TZX1_SORBI|nr:hypothetical protein BDA96_10G060700 [Sorghum bicolor]